MLALPTLLVNYAFASPHSNPDRSHEVTQGNDSTNSAVISQNAQPIKSEQKTQKLNTKIISDSLVKDLKCSELSRDNVLSVLQPDAFSWERELPIHNWGEIDAAGKRMGFKGSNNGLGQCWSLAHLQRIIFYMGRFNEPEPSDRSAYIKKLSATILGENDKNLEVFSIKDLGSLTNKFTEHFINNQEDESARGLKRDIEKYQSQHLYQFGNLGMLIGGSDRSRNENAQVFNQLRNDLERHRLPIVIVRESLSKQHAVVVKKVELDPTGNYAFDVYDSDSPGEEYSLSSISYIENEREFVAPWIVKEMGEFNVKTSPVGIFLVDEEDMDRIQDALYKHYTQVCNSGKVPPDETGVGITR